MKVAWLTDIHLNYLDLRGIGEFTTSVSKTKPHAVFITGDIGEADKLKDYLELLDIELKAPIYFVLGNHDFYGSSLDDTLASVERIASGSEKLFWMPKAGVVKLTDHTSVIGHRGWPDGRLGNYGRSRVMVDDFRFIRDFVGLGKSERLKLMQRLADDSATLIKKLLEEALKVSSEVFLLTHTPPFREACLYEGKISDDNHLPFFSSKVMGETILEIMEKHLDKTLTILCGHTHGKGDILISNNIKVFLGGAEYGKPAVQKVLKIK